MPCIRRHVRIAQRKSRELGRVGSGLPMVNVDAVIVESGRHLQCGFIDEAGEGTEGLREPMVDRLKARPKHYCVLLVTRAGSQDRTSCGTVNTLRPRDGA